MAEKIVEIALVETIAMLEHRRSFTASDGYHFKRLPWGVRIEAASCIVEVPFSRVHFIKIQRQETQRQEKKPVGQVAAEPSPVGASTKKRPAKGS